MRRKRPLCFEPMEGRQLLSGIACSLTTDQSTYQVGQPIHFTFTMTNTGDEPVTYLSGESDTAFTVTEGGQTVWSTYQGDEISMVLVTEVLQPGQSSSITGTWDGQVTSGGGDTIGTTAGSFVVTNQMDPGLSASFQIQPSPLTYSLSGPGDQIVQSGQPIDFSCTITNTSDQPVTFNRPPADFIVAGESDAIGTVWESDPGAASQPPTSETLQPGQSLTETATWNGIANEGSLAGSNVFDDFTVTVLGSPVNPGLDFLISSPLSGSVTSTGGAPDLSGDMVYQPGQPLLLTATETNTSDQPVTIPDSNDNFVLPGPTTVTIPSTNATANGPFVTLQPGQSETFTATWDPDANPASPAPAGTYPVSFQDTFQGFWGHSIVIDPQTPTGGGSTSPPGSTGSTSTAAPLAMTVMASPEPTGSSGPLRIRLTLDNVSKEKVKLAAFAGRAEITLLRGSTVVATASKRLSVRQAQNLRPGRSLHLTTELAIRPSRSKSQALEPGTYTLEVEDGGYTAETTLEIRPS